MTSKLRDLVMPVPIAIEVRWRIVWLHYHKEFSCKAIADLLYVNVTTVRRIIARYVATGEVAPDLYKHGPARLLGTWRTLTLGLITCDVLL